MSPSAMGYHFLPWVRFGVLSRVSKPDPLNATLSPRVQVDVKLRVNTTETEDVSRSLAVCGPGDVIGIDPREVIRTEPRHLTSDFPPNLFASIEFDRPDFPWLFTPASAGAANRLRPWIVLAVIRKSLATITMDPRLPLPTLSCPVSELPDLRESFLWAHAVFTGEVPATVDEQLAALPNQSIARLLCPRRLEPSQGGPDAGYIACVVPAFEVGRKAGLDIVPDATDATMLADAWDITTPGLVELPVYYQWEFNTGPDGDFEDAVDRLQAIRDVPNLPPAKMDASHPGSGVGDFLDAILPVGSVLRPVGQATAQLPANFGQLRQALRTVLEAPLGGGQTVSPPIYGRWQATGPGVQGPTPLASGAAPGWFAELNTDPRRRVAAALGAQVVQQQQEQLVASAWEQAGQVDAVNQWLRQKQLGREVTRAVYNKRLAPLSSPALQQITAPVALVATAPPPPIDRQFAGIVPRLTTITGTSTLMDAVVSAPFRRLTRPLGPSFSRPIGAVSASVQGLTALAMMTADDTMSSLLTKVVEGTLSNVEIVPTVETAPSSQIIAGTPTTTTTTAPLPTSQPPPPTSTQLAQLDPEATFALEAQARLQLPPELSVGRVDALQPVMLTPTFPQPMYEPLRDLFAQMLLPGIDRVPDNSLMLLEVDAAFIEAYMAGLNDELSRELLWREFPTTLRGTYFRQFWDVRGQLPADASEAQREQLRDIPPVAQWQATSLGSNMPAARGRGLLFLLVKGDLLARFPTALIYAARAKWTTDSSGRSLQVIDEAQPLAFPQMRLDPVPGVSLLGFSLVRADGVPVTVDTIAGGMSPPSDPGWFFVLEEHPTEPRFGLDITAGALTTWRELAWPQVATRQDGSGYIAAAAKVPTLVAPPSTESQDRYLRELNITWGSNAAAMGYITLQKPFREEVHAGYWFLRADAQFVRQSVPTTMVAGANYSVSITMRNTGTSTWTPGGTNPFRLGSQSPADNTRWGSARRELTAPVPPGTEVTFAFPLTAPPAGSYIFQWRMVHELIEWFGAPTPALTITVNPATTYSVYGRSLTLGIGGTQL